ncbi:MAG: ankyrin repeat domain-containing protein [Wolbachia sp.]
MKDGSNRTLLHYVTETKGLDYATYVGRKDYTVGAGRLDIIRYLVEEKSVDFNTQDSSEKTPLNYAAEAGKLDVVEYFESKMQEKKIEIFSDPPSSKLDNVSVEHVGHSSNIARK